MRKRQLLAAFFWQKTSGLSKTRKFLGKISKGVLEKK